MDEREIMPVCRCGHTTHQHAGKTGKCAGNSRNCHCTEYRALPGHERKWSAADLISPHYRTRAR